MNDTKPHTYGWTETTLVEVVEFQRGFDLPTKDRTAGSYPLMVSNGQDGTHNKYKVKAPGIVTGRSGTIGKVFFVNQNFWPFNTTLWIKNFHGNDEKFVYYFLKTIPFEKYNVGSGVPTLNRNHIHPILVKIPLISEQNSIATVLTSFDNKIELLHNQNQTLEEIAQTLFKEWFVDYRFPGVGKMIDSDLGMIPEVWRVGKLKDLLEIKYGKDHKHLEEGKIPVYGSGGIMRYVNKSLYSSESILIPRKGTLSNLYYVNKPFWSVDTMFYTKIKNKEYGKYCFLLLGRMNLASMDVGSAVPSLTTKLLNEIRIVIPDFKTMKIFDDLISTIFEKKKFNEIQIQTLAQLRDKLLPKLMNGEVKVKLTK